MPLRHLLLACVPLTLAQAAHSAQAQSWSGTPAARYEERFREVWQVLPDETRAAEVRHLTLRRDGATLTLEEGRLFLLKPIGGQAMGALFRGKGRLSYTPGTQIEQERLTLFRKRALRRPGPPVRRHHARRAHPSAHLRAGRGARRTQGPSR